MSDAQRYDLKLSKWTDDWEMGPDENGDYVLLTDYAALKARLEEAERLLLKFHTAGPAGITALIDEVPAFLGITDSAPAGYDGTPTTFYCPRCPCERCGNTIRVGASSADEVQK